MWDARAPMRTRTLFALGIALCIAAGTPAGGLSAPALDGEFPVSGPPRYLTAGPDGNVWFTLASSTAAKEFGRIGPDGTVVEFDSPTNAGGGNGITAGPDGRLWIAETQRVVRVDPASPDAGASFPVPDLADARGIAAGPDGNLWAASGDKVLKISTAGSVVDTYTVAGMGARGIAAGGDGNLWIADFGGQRVIRITTAGVATPFPVGGGPQEVAAGTEGRMAFTNPGADPQIVGRIGADGTIQPTPTPLADPFGIALGDDGAWWTAQFAGSSLGRVTPEGGYTQLPLTAGSGPRYLTRGAGGTLWVGLETANRIARITGVEAPASGPPGPGGEPPAPPGGLPAPARPAVSALRLTPRAFRVAPRRPAGTRVRFRASHAGTAVLRVLRPRPGRVRARRCVVPARASRVARRCTRYVGLGALRRRVAAGSRVVRFTGRLGRRALRPGRYRLTVTLTDAAGSRSAPRSVAFRILPRSRRS